MRKIGFCLLLLSGCLLASCLFSVPEKNSELFGISENFGIEWKLHGRTGYWLDGEEVSRTEAMALVERPEKTGARIGGRRSPDGKTEIQCDLPGDLHKANITSRGSGCCVWRSIHHAAVWQNVSAYLMAPEWIRAKGIPGGASPGSVTMYLPKMAKDRGFNPPPKFIQHEGSDLEFLKAACKSGRMPGVTYCFSPTGRYGGGRIAHMVSLPHADDHWFCVLDNNYIGDKAYEWMSPAEFRKTWTGMGGGWAVVLLNPPPPPPPHN